jgi:hypothetical protein
MIDRNWIVLAGAIAMLLVVLHYPAFAQEPERLTGHGTVLVSVSSGGTATEGVRMTVDFRLSLDRSGQYTGEFRAEAARETPVVVVIDGVTYGLVQIAAGPPFQVDTDGRRFTSSSTNGLVTLSAPSGRTSFEGVLRFEGEEGGVGTPFRFSFEVGGRGEQSAIRAVGTWQTPPGVQFIPKQILNPNQLLTGLYSGEFHGLVRSSSLQEEHKVMGVFVIGFDGSGGVTSGRITFLGVGPNPIQPGSFYQVDSDGFGRLSIEVGFFPEPFVFHIAVFEGGKGAKIGLSTINGFRGVGTTGELRKQ